jgi:hypothetical protein
MQIFMFCFFIVAVICLVQGLRKSSFGSFGGSKQHCALCGWTKEKVQLCRVKQHNTIKVTSLCLDCSVKHNATPIQGTAVGTTCTAYV